MDSYEYILIERYGEGLGKLHLEDKNIILGGNWEIVCFYIDQKQSAYLLQIKRLKQC